jgi:hypothetical protein
MMKVASLLLASAALLLAETPLGKPLTLKSPVTVNALLETADQNVGSVVQVKGKVTEVCQMMGCWMALTGTGGKMVRIKVADGEIVFPKDSVGKQAIAEGKLQKLELSREQAVARARHEAEEQGRTFDPATIKSGGVVWQIQGTGAVLLK